MPPRHGGYVERRVLLSREHCPSVPSCDRNVGRLGEVLTDERQRPRDAYTNSVALEVTGNSESEAGKRIRIVPIVMIAGHCRPEPGQTKPTLSRQGHPIVRPDEGARHGLSRLAVRVARCQHELEPATQESAHRPQGGVRREGVRREALENRDGPAKVASSAPGPGEIPANRAVPGGSPEVGVSTALNASLPEDDMLRAPAGRPRQATGP